MKFYEIYFLFMLKQKSINIDIKAIKGEVAYINPKIQQLRECRFHLVEFLWLTLSDSP